MTHSFVSRENGLEICHRAILSLDFFDITVDYSIGKLTATKPITLFSWGNDIEIYVIRQQIGFQEGFEVSIFSVSKIPIQLFGRNESVETDILNEIKRLLL
jgi:hypothetical protein